VGLGFSRETWILRAVLPGIPLVGQAHSATLPKGWRRWHFRWGAGALDATLFCALEQGEFFKQHGLLPAAQPILEVIEVSTLFGPGDRLAARAASGLEGDPCLFWLGNLDANKDPLMVLDAVAEAAVTLPNLRLYMCFLHGPLLPQVRERICVDPALTARVTLLGTLPGPLVETYLRAADFVVQASHREGSGYGIIEALACGTTPLVTDIPSFRRITGNGQYGALVPTDDRQALAREIVVWSRRDRAALRRGAREQFERELSYDAIGRQLREAYVRAVATRTTLR
jgi:glycosyltransferase involved in cell wall biosynthesis